MRTIYLVRHTQYDNPRHILVGRLPVTLSNEGVAEAEKLADFFADKKIVKIYHSPVERCKQTSQIIAQNDIPLESSVKIAETFSAYQGYWVEDYDHFYSHLANLGGESPTDIQTRMVEFWEEIKDKDKGNVIICSHGDPLYFLYAYLLHLPIPEQPDLFNLPDDQYQPKASIRPIIYDRGKISVSPLITIDQL